MATWPSEERSLLAKRGHCEAAARGTLRILAPRVTAEAAEDTGDGHGDHEQHSHHSDHCCFHGPVWPRTTEQPGVCFGPHSLPTRREELLVMACSSGCSPCGLLRRYWSEALAGTRSGQLGTPHGSPPTVVGLCHFSQPWARLPRAVGNSTGGSGRSAVLKDISSRLLGCRSWKESADFVQREPRSALW